LAPATTTVAPTTTVTPTTTVEVTPIVTATTTTEVVEVRDNHVSSHEETTEIPQTGISSGRLVSFGLALLVVGLSLIIAKKVRKK
jgi:LPXTG-motif cell wall-anchored protein